MKIIIDQMIHGEHFKGTMRKIYHETSIIPMKGMLIEDSAWKKEKVIENVVLNLQEKSYYIIVTVDNDNYKDVKKMYESHGWMDVLDIDKRPLAYSL